MYTCSKCGKAVIVIPGKPPVPTCNCGAPIIANVSAVTRGSSTLRK